MDPNAALNEIRRRITQYDDATGDEADAIAHGLVSLVEGLDQWIAKGGFLPDDWDHSDDGPIRRLLADWFEAALFRISEVGHSGDWPALIDDAKARHETFGIEWSNSFVPDYVRELLAMNDEEN